MIAATRSSQAVNREQLGQAAEHRALSELLLRGFEPMRVCIDRGVDYVLPGGSGLQVKAARKSEQCQYRFKLVQFRPAAAWYEDPEEGRKTVIVRPPTAPDFWLLWGVDEDRWFVVPASAVEGQTCLWTNKHKPALLEAFEGAWELLAEGGEE